MKQNESKYSKYSDLDSQDERDRTIVRVERLLIYEGERWWVEATLARSLPVGVTQRGPNQLIKVQETEFAGKLIVNREYLNTKRHKVPLYAVGHVETCSIHYTGFCSCARNAAVTSLPAEPETMEPL